MTKALAEAGHNCEVFVSGPKVQIDANTAFEPDVVVTRASVSPGMLVPEPLIVVEVLSVSTRERDFTIELAGYAALPSLAHYLLVDTERRLVVHHRRIVGEQEFRTSIVRAGWSASNRRGWISTSTPSTPAAAPDVVAAAGALTQSGKQVPERHRDEPEDVGQGDDHQAVDALGARRTARLAGEQEQQQRRAWGRTP